MKKKVYRELHAEPLFVSRDVEGNVQDIKTFTELKENLVEPKLTNAKEVKVKLNTKKKASK